MGEESFAGRYGRKVQSQAISLQRLTGNVPEGEQQVRGGQKSDAHHLVARRADGGDGFIEQKCHADTLLQGAVGRDLSYANLPCHCEQAWRAWESPRKGGD